MAQIEIDRHPSPERLEELGVSRWPVWTKGVSSFPWSYDEPETCLFLEGEAIVTPEGGPPAHIAAGDLVTFPAGLSCTWDVRKPVKKHYRFG